MAKDRSEALKQKAYEIWEREGRPEGMHDEHWAQAQRELDGEVAEKPKATRSRKKPGAPEETAGMVADVPVKKPAAAKPASPAPKPKKPARTKP
ncbi:DUF2934 domain-containing protein [Aquibium sp. LZ166]|uniref:DUF2934 domain-containing protein n=1 Tax=Aquibium pacificus TaxID=3153579 RepID=A0ABV3SGR2_9HYPH